MQNIHPKNDQGHMYMKMRRQIQIRSIVIIIMSIRCIACIKSTLSKTIFGISSLLRVVTSNILSAAMDVASIAGCAFCVNVKSF